MPGDEMRRWSDERLASAATSEPEAFGELYRRHAEAVLAYALYRTRSAEAALDLTAEVFAAALAGVRRYDPARGPFRAWLFGIAGRKLAARGRRWAVHDRARRRIGMERIEFDDHELERVEELVDLRRAHPPLAAMVGDLPPAEREAVLAKVVDERDYREIAAALGCSEGAARMRVSRALARLALTTREQER